ncbi:MAG: hypothetical protein AW09_004218 [Candidatus Accumulibacter phosphatis]|uniref:Uncharacterized protein n=1 Tax=Candidatus Accumulibacter phosphatis TaxID=327160 RepID=A0A080LR70_9PROT|nr:MAG: hypothetical protein AW09_004218 [Candidatus Accumulibacter phosphatis]
MLVEHLAIDRIQALLATENLPLYAGLAQLAGDPFENSRQQLAPVTTRRLERARQNACAHRIDELEREILQLAEKLVETEPVGNRCVNLERLASDAAAFVGTYRRHRLQIVMTIGELDQHHAQIARHGHQHLAEILRLRLFLRLKLDLVELRQAIDEISDRFAETLGNFALANRRILHHVVQERCNHSLDIHLPFSDGARHRQRMGDVGFTRQALLPTMRVLAEQIRFSYALDLFRRKIAQAVDEDMECRIVLGKCRLRSVSSHWRCSGQAGCNHGIHDLVLRHRGIAVRPDRG